MKKPQRTKPAKPVAASKPPAERDDAKPAATPATAALLPEDLPKDERIDRENDLA